MMFRGLLFTVAVPFVVIIGLSWLIVCFLFWLDPNFNDPMPVYYEPYLNSPNLHPNLPAR